MTTEIVIAPSGVGIFGFVEHKVHDDEDSAPKYHLFVPEQDFAEVEKAYRDPDRSDRDSPSHHGVVDGGIGPNGQATKVQEHGDDSSQFEPPADREKHLEKSKEYKGRTDHFPHHPHVMVAAGVLLFGRNRLCGRLRSFFLLGMMGLIWVSHELSLKVFAECERLLLIG